MGVTVDEVELFVRHIAQEGFNVVEVEAQREGVRR
jgi:hypothetical protein